MRAKKSCSRERMDVNERAAGTQGRQEIKASLPAMLEHQGQYILKKNKQVLED